MGHLVFDIETVGVDWETLDETTRDYLLKFAETEEEQQEVREKVGLYPLTGEIVAIGLHDPEQDIQSVFFQAPESELPEHYEEEGVHYFVGDEQKILDKFWASIRKYKTYVTFNGREFDNPYIMLRSAANRVSCQRNLVPYRFSVAEHIDLLDQLTFYRATRKFTMDYYCKRFGITSPKEEGVTGLDVPQLYENGDYQKIAEYCMRDVLATSELFQVWQKYVRTDR